MRTVLFGVDGLTFRVLHPLMERGDLPNFHKLKESGCEAILESKYPPVTPAAWTSISTGMKPATHGVYDFWEYEEQHKPGTPRTARVQTRRKGAKAIWNILSEYGKQVLVINVPVTYPPEAVNGVMISGYLTPSSQVNFTYPQSFKEELYREVPNYQIDLDHEDMFCGKAGRLIDATLKMTENRVKLTLYLMKEKPWDFCYVAFVGADRLQHPLWEDIMTMDTRATEYFRLLDAGLGLILEQLTPEDSLFVVSDHGFQGATRFFDINEYLSSIGLLKLETSSQQNKSIHSANLKYTLKQMGLLLLARKAKEILKKTGAVKEHLVDVYQPMLTEIDWARTKAFVPSMSGFLGGYADIFLSNDLDTESITELCEDLKRQVDPQTGKPLIDAIYTTQAFGKGPYAPREPHLLLLPTEGLTFRMSMGNKHLWDDPNGIPGTHQKDGVLYAYGGSIKRGFKAPSAEIYDIVPTLLRSMNLPLPCEFDGRVLDELFVECKQTEPMLVSSNIGVETGLAKRKLKKLLEG